MKKIGPNFMIHPHKEKVNFYPSLSVGCQFRQGNVQEIPSHENDDCSPSLSVSLSLSRSLSENGETRIFTAKFGFRYNAEVKK